MTAFLHILEYFGAGIGRAGQGVGKGKEQSEMMIGLCNVITMVYGVYGLCFTVFF